MGKRRLYLSESERQNIILAVVSLRLKSASDLICAIIRLIQQ